MKAKSSPWTRFLWPSSEVYIVRANDPIRKERCMRHGAVDRRPDSGCR
jgi:hypothetical protein